MSHFFYSSILLFKGTVIWHLTNEATTFWFVQKKKDVKPELNLLNSLTFLGGWQRCSDVSTWFFFTRDFYKFFLLVSLQDRTISILQWEKLQRWSKGVLSGLWLIELTRETYDFGKTPHSAEFEMEWPKYQSRHSSRTSSDSPTKKLRCHGLFSSWNRFNKNIFVNCNKTL